MSDTGTYAAIKGEILARINASSIGSVADSALYVTSLDELVQVVGGRLPAIGVRLMVVQPQKDIGAGEGLYAIGAKKVNALSLWQVIVADFSGRTPSDSAPEAWQIAETVVDRVNGTACAVEERGEFYTWAGDELLFPAQGVSVYGIGVTFELPIFKGK